MMVTFEESVATGGFGSAVLELLEEARLTDPAYRDVALRIVGIPGDRFVDHGSVVDLRRVLRLDGEGLADQVRETLAAVRATPGRSEVDRLGGAARTRGCTPLLTGSQQFTGVAPRSIRHVGRRSAAILSTPGQQLRHRDRRWHARPPPVDSGQRLPSGPVDGRHRSPPSR